MTHLKTDMYRRRRRGGDGLAASAKARVRSLSKWSIRGYADIRGVRMKFKSCVERSEKIWKLPGNRFTWPRMIIEVRPWNCIARRELSSSLERERKNRNCCSTADRVDDLYIAFSLRRLSSVFSFGSIHSCSIDVPTEILLARRSSPRCENLREGHIFGNKRSLERKN